MSREGKREAESAGAGTLASPGLATSDEASGDVDLREDCEKRASLAQLRERYVEARKLVSSDEPYANLEWILGARRNITQDPQELGTKTVELVALWLQDLAVEVDNRVSSRPTGESDGSAPSSCRAPELAAQNLRDATRRFLQAFRISSAKRTEAPASLCFDSGSSR